MVFTRRTAAVAILAVIVAAPIGHAQNLDGLLRLKNFTAHRASSSDPSGGNLDMRRVEAGQTLTLAELQGPGVITHIVDPIPFRKSILVNIEHGWQNNERSDWYSSVAYWYQAGKPSPRAALPPSKDRMPAYLRPHDYGGGRWEGEDFVDAAKATNGEVQDVGMEFWGDLFSRQYALQWEAQKPGDGLTVPIAISHAGRYRITARLGRTEAGGRFTLGLDDAPPTEPISLYQPPPFPDLFDAPVAEADLTSGTHALKFTSVEPDSRSKGRRLLLDRIQVTDLSPAAPPKK